MNDEFLLEKIKHQVALIDETKVAIKLAVRTAHKLRGMSKLQSTVLDIYVEEAVRAGLSYKQIGKLVNGGTSMVFKRLKKRGVTYSDIHAAAIESRRRVKLTPELQMNTPVGEFSQPELFT